MKKIVIIDDDEHIRHLTEVLLATSGFDCTSAENAEEGLKTVTRVHPHLLVCDVMMPGMNGFEFITELRKHPNVAEIPVMLLTAKKQEEDLHEGYAQGADYYLTKPFTKDQLIYGVNLLLGDD